MHTTRSGGALLVVAVDGKGVVSHVDVRCIVSGQRSKIVRSAARQPCTLSSQPIGDVQDVRDAARFSYAARLLVITGAGRLFCAGLDLKEQNHLPSGIWKARATIGHLEDMEQSDHRRTERTFHARRDRTGACARPMGRGEVGQKRTAGDQVGLVGRRRPAAVGAAGGTVACQDLRVFRTRAHCGGGGGCGPQ